MQSQEKKIEEVLSRRVEQVLPAKGALKKLLQKRKIRVYLGIDPTGSKLHLGHTIVLRKLQEFAELGHEAILVVGTGTVLAGDPSGRDKMRSLITEKEIKKNIRSWKKQASKILDFSKVKIRYNGQWLLKLGLRELIQIASQISAVKLFQREMFQKRLKKGGTVWTHELLYPLLQGYDSVFLRADLEIGGTDQTFNMLIGRELEEKILKKEKFVLTCPMILGINGKPMSKTSGNCVWIEDEPLQMFGKIMSIPDKLMSSYFELLTDFSSLQIEQYKRELSLGKINPRELKEKLAFEIVKTYHSLRAAEEAKKEFERIFKEKKLPTEIPQVVLTDKKLNVLDLLVKTKLASSRSEAKRLILQKGVKINGQIEDNWQKVLIIQKDMVVQVGKRKFVRVSLR